MAPLRVLLTNDDGPPNAVESPNIYSFSRALVDQLGWDVKVVTPSSQKSWVGASYKIQGDIIGHYYYPKGPQGLQGETSETSRPLKEGEVAEWILLDGTPATVTNIALHNIYPGKIDLVLSGPNHGRNSSSAFSVSSGTIGAALSASISGFKAIACSYGVVKRPVTQNLIDAANDVTVKVVKGLWDDWGKDAESKNGNVALYSVNVPLVKDALIDPRYFLTRTWRNSYDRLFAPIEEQESPTEEGDASLLRFHFKPNMSHLVNPVLSSLPVGTDAYAIHEGWISITPLRASFAEPSDDALTLGSGKEAGEMLGVGREWLLGKTALSQKL